MKPYYEADGIALYHGDCLSPELLPLWTAGDVLVTDPPYGIAYRSGWREGGGPAIEGDATPEARDRALAAWGARPALVFGAWRVTRPEATHTLLTWDKGGGAGMGDLSIPWKPNTEEVYVLGRGFQGSRDTSVLRFDSLKGRPHPTEKPIGLMIYLLSKRPAGVVVDPFAGSGATLAAAKREARKAIGVECEERWCEAIARRLGEEPSSLFSGSAGGLTC